MWVDGQWQTGRRSSRRGQGVPGSRLQTAWGVGAKAAETKRRRQTNREGQNARAPLETLPRKPCDGIQRDGWNGCGRNTGRPGGDLVSGVSRARADELDAHVETSRAPNAGGV